MKKSPYTNFMVMGLCSMLLIGCSNGSDLAESSSSESTVESSAESSESTSQTNESSSSQEETSESSAAESDSAAIGIDDELVMDPAVVLLPTDLPENSKANIVTNSEEEYTVAYTDEQGNDLATVSGTIYTNADTALAEMEAKMNGAVQVTPNEETAIDLGHGIEGYGEGAAGNQYFSWEEGNWDFTIHSLSVDEMDNPGIAEKMVDYLEENMLPAPSEKGMMLVDYPQGGRTVSVDIMWQKENRVYELSTSQVPLKALEMAVSME